MEIGWTCSMFWEASALACKVTAFFRALCFYLSGFVIMVISIDNRHTAGRNPPTAA